MADQMPPPPVLLEWKEFYKELKWIDQVRIPRWLGTALSGKIQIHVYCDALSQAYGAAVNVRVCTNDGWSARLLCSKSTVAPVKIVTIPRLEMLAVELGCKLLGKVEVIPMFEKAPVFMWTDSEIVLYWLRKSTDHLKVFVSNRVTNILAVIKVEQTRHVQSEDNPADLLTRGISTQALIDSSLWWNSPKTLREETESWQPWKATDRTDPEFESQVGAETKEPDMPVARVSLTMMTAKNEEVDVLD